MKNALIVLVIVIATGIGAVVTTVILASRDIPAPDITDLIVKRFDLPPEQNAFTYFVSATNTFHQPINVSLVTDYLDGKSVDEDGLVEIVVKNKRTFYLIEQGLECQRCIAPEVTGFDTLLPYLSPWRGMGRVLALKTRHDRLAGRYSDATDTCISLLKFADMIQADAACIVNYLVGIGILNLGLAQAQDIARDNGAPPDEIKRLSDALFNLGHFANGLVSAIKGEYRSMAGMVDQFRDGKFRMDEFMGLGCDNLNPMLKDGRIPSYFFHPNRTKLAFANFYRAMIKNAPLCYADMRRHDMEEHVCLNASKAQLLMRPNAAGRMLYARLIPSLANLLEIKCKTECSVAATRILVACNAYRRKEKKLPDDLQSLLPAYLAAIPADPYDGKPFRYSSAIGAVYSVGKDIKDSGGSSAMPAKDGEDTPSKRRWKAEDVVFEIEGESQKARKRHP